MGNTARILEASGSTLKGVDETLQTSKSVLEETRKNLDTANKNLEITSRTLVSSKEASSYASGGESYPVVFPHDDGAGHVAFSFQKNGKYPLFSLKVFGGKASDILPTVVHYLSVGASREFPEFGGNVSYPLWFAPFPEEKSTYYSVTMFARNGSWEEVINIMR